MIILFNTDTVQIKYALLIIFQITIRQINCTSYTLKSATLFCRNPFIYQLFQIIFFYIHYFQTIHLQTCLNEYLLLCKQYHLIFPIIGFVDKRI